MRNRIFLALAFYCFLSTTATAQTTAFTYQGKLTDGGTLANGQYDLQIKLFDALTEGAQQGTTLSLSNVAVVNGVFTVQLDFGACDSCFNGAARYLEVAVKKTTDATFVTLAPRQPVSSTPYAMKTRNLSFNGAYNDGTMIFTASNTFAGEGAGVNTTPSGTLNDFSGKFNSFYGAGAGQANTTGNLNSFFGTQAGLSNTIGTHDTFFGLRAGFSNTTGSSNAFFGYLAGASNTTGFQNAFFGIQVGNSNTTGTNNTFFGSFADFSGTNTTGSNNTLLGYFGRVAANLTNATAIGARASVTQSNSLVLGDNANVGIGTTAPAYKLHVIDSSNTGLRVQTNLAGGTLASFGGSGDFLIDAPSIGGGRFVVKESGNVGIGAPAPAAKLQVVTADDTNPGIIAAWDGRHVVIGGTASTGGIGMSYDQVNGVGYLEALSPNVAWRNLIIQSGGGRVGIGTTAPDQLLTVNGNASKPGGGSWATFSDERLKNIHGLYTRGLQALMQLQPIRYEYKPNNALGLRSTGEYIGFSAQEVEHILPEAVSRSASGYLQINNDPILWTILNAVKEQQAQLQTQQEQLRERERQAAAQQSRLTQYESQLLRQEQELAALKRMVCASRPRAEGCRATKRKK